jgi:hypothetical protein
LIGKLNEKYSGLIPGFIEQVSRKEVEMSYQPKIVVDDDAEDEDEDNE